MERERASEKKKNIWIQSANISNVIFVCLSTLLFSLKIDLYAHTNSLTHVQVQRSRHRLWHIYWTIFAQCHRGQKGSAYTQHALWQGHIHTQTHVMQYTFTALFASALTCRRVSLIRSHINVFASIAFTETMTLSAIDVAFAARPIQQWGAIRKIATNWRLNAKQISRQNLCNETTRPNSQMHVAQTSIDEWKKPRIVPASEMYLICRCWTFKLQFRWINKIK